MPKKNSPSSKDKSEMSIEERYKKKSTHEHILTLPDTWIGSVQSDTMNMWVFDDNNNKIVKKEITFVPGLYKIYDEILVNARDHSIRDKTCKTIKVSFNQEEGRITVFNDGKGIPVQIHKELGIYVPEMIFAHTMTSENYEQKGKIVGGKNGIGAKATNIYSNVFEIETYDADSGKKYFQKCENNMFTINKPVIEDIKDKKTKPFTQISFIPDFKRFGIKSLTNDHMALFKKRVYDLAACTHTGVKVYLNDKLIEVKTFDEYINMFYEKPPSNIIYEEVNDRWKVGIIYDNDNGFNQISYVNGICTYQGGTHVQYILDQITNKLLAYIKAKHKNINVKSSQIRENLTLFVDSVIEDPAFSSQTKEFLTSKTSLYGSTCEIPDKMIDALIKTGIVEDVVKLAQFKAMEELKKTDGKKVKTLRGITKLDDALWAGTNKAKDCYLILTEGDSAKKFAVDGLDVIGREQFGVFPLRGKLLNVREATGKQILNNEEFTNIKQIMGLKQNKKYDDTSKLRYGGGIIILTDADVDGSHIKGLIINMFHRFWPSLLKREGFIQAMSTPIVKVHKKSDTKKTEPMVFFTQSEYKKWEEEQKENGTYSKWDKPKYYKGLGTSTTAEAKELFMEFKKRVIKYVWESPFTNNENKEVKEEKVEKKSSPKSKKSDDVDTETDKESNLDKDEEDDDDDDDITDMNSKSYDAITLAFERARANDRKNWLRAYNREIIAIPKDGYLGYSDFINKDLIHFSNYDNIRSLPSLCDGLKPSQRKILYASILRNIFKNEIKVAALASFTQESTEYHHGEMSLQGAIINMAQDFVGTNNINVLTPNGNFGSRREGGSDAASSRYIFTQLNQLNKYIFRPEDSDILNHLVEEGKKIEPEYFAPVIPMILVNGSEGIGTGFSTSVPSFNPKDIINNIVNMLDGKEPVNIKPWYRGFNGSITKVDDSKYVATGTYEVIDDCTIKITELPVGVWTSKYKESVLEKCLVDPKSKKPTKTQFIENYTNLSGNNNVHFEITFAGNSLQQMIKQDSLVKNLKLSANINLSNMYLYDSNHVITKYDTVVDIFTEFYDVRHKLYVKRRNYRIKQLTNQMDLLKYKVKFISQIVNNELVVNKKKKEVLYKELRELKYPELANDCDAADSDKSYEYLTGMNILTLTEEKIDELNKLYLVKKKELEDYQSITVEELWKRELLELSDHYDKWFTEKEQEMNDSNDKNKKSKTKKKKNSNKPRTGKVVVVKGTAKSKSKAKGKK